MQKKTFRQSWLKIVLGTSLLILAQHGEASAAPYYLPIAGYGPTAPNALSAEGLSLQQYAHQVGYAKFTAPDWQEGNVRHVVMLRYKEGTTMDQRNEVTRRFLHLAQDSRRPNGKAVIKSIEYGDQSTGSGLSYGFQQIFVVSFRSEGDRNYFIGKPVVTDPQYFDPAHEAFVQFSAPYIEKVLVFDYNVRAVMNKDVSSKKRKH
ncbi:Dabb family protein [Swingsia samuiensis]|nr:Dabb family protein [Swingsia samuiensis]